MINNLISCFLFNLTGVGFYYYLSLLGDRKRELNQAGTAIFWGWWAAMLFTYIIWLIIPNHLNFACYITFIISLIGLIFLIKQKQTSSFLKSDYFIALLFLLPFIYLIKYFPTSYDEFSHWLSAPKAFYYTRSLTPDESIIPFPSYTPLWTLQAAFFQFFTFSNFDESLIYAFRINLFLSFLFFVKETLKLRPTLHIILSLIVVYILYKWFTFYYTKYLLIEFPLYIIITSTLLVADQIQKNNSENIKNNNLLFFFIAVISAYMLKSVFISLALLGVFYLWLQNYKKYSLYLIFSVLIFYVSWKFKTNHYLNFGKLDFTLLEKFHIVWGEYEKTVFSLIKERSLLIRNFFLYFIISMISIFFRNKNLFYCYTIFSIVYLFGLIFTYIFVLPVGVGLVLCSYERYLSVLFMPAIIFCLCLIMSKIQNLFFSNLDSDSNIKFRYFIAGCVALIVGSVTYHFNKPHMMVSDQHKYIKVGKEIKELYNFSGKRVIVINQTGNDGYAYHFKYGLWDAIDAPYVEGGVFTKEFHPTINKNEFFDKIKTFDVIITLSSDEWFEDILFELTGHKIKNPTNFLIVKKENKYDFLKLSKGFNEDR